MFYRERSMKEKIETHDRFMGVGDTLAKRVQQRHTHRTKSAIMRASENASDPFAAARTRTHLKRGIIDEPELVTAQTAPSW